MNNLFYYDLTSDSANLGMDRDIMSVGDEFTHNGETFEIIEIENFNQTWLIEKIIKVTS